MSKTMKGTLMTLIAGIAWGLSGSLWPVPDGSWIYSNWFDHDSFSFSGAVLLLLAYLADKEKSERPF